jgi:CSLREA domain-containing protein
MNPTKQHKTNFILTQFTAIALILSMPTNPVEAASRASSTSRENLAVGKTFTVNSTADAPDADPSNGICAAASGKCTLRAAIMESNFTAVADTIIVPAAVYKLTRPGSDDGALIGDLDITTPMAIQGAGAGLTIVDGNGAVTGDRVFQITANATETTLSGLTVRNGKKLANTFDEGGGIYWDGGGSHLLLRNVVVENNASHYGGGLYLNFSNLGDVVDLDHITVHANSATAAAGGLGANFGDFASLDLHESQVDSNTAYEGGGVYFQGTTTFNLLSVNITNSLIFLNRASLSGGFENHSGNAAVPVSLHSSKLYQNHADFYGGALGNYGALDISTSTLDSNTADSSSAASRGGGIYEYEGGQLDIKQSTLSRNTSKTGGGFYSEFFVHNNAGLVLTNSTLSGNSAARDGGGIYADGGQIKLYNATIAANQVLVPNGIGYTGMGGGVYIAARVGFSAQNALIADNTHLYGASLPVSDDCLGPVSSLGYNLIEETANCTIGGTLTGNITGQDPKLGPLLNNGGLTQTQKLLLGSPAIDAGEQPSCTDDAALSINTDQRGIHRPIGAACDIGAFELPLTSMFKSIGANDGWILESSETSNQGGSLNATQTTFQLGDDASNRQYRSFLSFHTADLPDNAVITSAVLMIKPNGAAIGSNPFNILGSLLGDMREPYFGSAAGLQLADFNAAAGQVRVGAFNKTPVSGWYSATMNANGRNNINRTGITQFRLYFLKDDNNNHVADFMKFFSGNAPVASRPQLVIEYYAP